MARYKIINEPIKTSHSFEYTLNDYVKITLAKKSLLFPVIEKQTGEKVGYYYDGPMGIIADFLIHTKKGAVGYTIEKSYPSMFLFPADIDFLLDYTKEAKPIDQKEFEENIENALHGTTFSLTLIKKLKSSQENYLFLSKKPFSVWMIEKDKMLWISPPKIIGREEDKKVFVLSPKELVFADNERKTVLNNEFCSPEKIIKKLKQWILTLKPTPFSIILDYL